MNEPSSNLRSVVQRRPLLLVPALVFLALICSEVFLFFSLESPTTANGGGSDVASHDQSHGLSWLDWISEETRSGRWAQPHRGAFCPPPSVFDISFKLLPNEFDGKRGLIQTVTQDLAWIYHDHGRKIKDAFDAAGEGILVTNSFPDGTPCRSQLKDTRFLAGVEQELGQLFNAVPHPTNGLAVYRMSNPKGLSEPEKEWVSETWHIDNFDDNGFKVLVYCSDVGDDNAPFEYQDPPTYVPVISRDTTNWFANTRLNYIGPSRRVLARAGTAIVFKNSNLPHKGNYCRRGIRDVIVFHFISR